MGFRHKFWPNGKTFRISMLDATRERVDHVMYAARLWSQYANVNFVYSDIWMFGDMRIQLHPGLGSWSYVGTDNELIDRFAPTMNLGWIDESIRDGDISTALHEIGHFLGLGHEHQNPNSPFDWNRDAVIADLTSPPNSWSIDQIEHNVLRRIAIDEVDATNLDRESIMMYFFPAHWTNSGIAQPANKHLSATDISFISRIYPKARVSINSFIDDLIYNRRTARRLDEKQLRIVLEALSVAIDSEDCKQKLRDKLINLLKV